MIPIIKYRERKTETTYYICFDWNNGQGGFSFPCNKYGELEKLNPEAEQNYLKCQSGEYDVTYKGVRPYTHSWVEPAEARCDCGHIIILASFTNTCEKCGADYNMSGQHLAPRSQWGEETGESLSEILDIGHTIS